MTIVRCAKTDCKLNKNEKCTAKTIEIEVRVYNENGAKTTQCKTAWAGEPFHLLEKTLEQFNEIYRQTGFPVSSQIMLLKKGYVIEKK